MKKQLYKILIGMNIAVIALVLIVSGTLLYFSSSENHQIFGYSAFLFHNNDANESNINSQQYSLLIIENKSEPHVGDKASFYVRDEYNNKVQFVDIIKSISDGTALFEETEHTAGISSDLFVGKVIAQNNFLGEIIASAVNSKNTILIYSVLVGFFVIISGVLIALWIINAKKNQHNDDPTEEDLLLAQEQIQNISGDIASENENDLKLSKPKIRVDHIEGSVFPHGLSRPHLTKGNPLFEPRAIRNRTEQPVNIGTGNEKSAKNNILSGLSVADPVNDDDDIKLYTFDKNGNPVFADKSKDTTDELSTHTIVLSNDADTGELIKLTRRDDTLNDILKLNATETPRETVKAVNTVEPILNQNNEKTANTNNDIENSEYKIDTNYDFDAILNDIINKTEQDFLKELDQK